MFPTAFLSSAPTLRCAHMSYSDGGVCMRVYVRVYVRMRARVCVCMSGYTHVFVWAGEWGRAHVPPPFMPRAGVSG